MLKIYYGFHNYVAVSFGPSLMFSPVCLSTSSLMTLEEATVSKMSLPKGSTGSEFSVDYNLYL